MSEKTELIQKTGLRNKIDLGVKVLNIVLVPTGAIRVVRNEDRRGIWKDSAELRCNAYVTATTLDFAKGFALYYGVVEPIYRATTQIFS